MPQTLVFTTLPQASHKLKSLLGDMRTDLKNLSQTSKDAFQDYRNSLVDAWQNKWPQVTEEYKQAIQKMPKALRRRDFVKTMIADLENFDKEIRLFTQNVKELTAQDWRDKFAKQLDDADHFISHLQNQTKLVSEQITALEENTLVQKFMRGEPVYSCRTKLQWRRKIFHLGMGLSFLCLFVYAGLSELALNVLSIAFILFCLNLEILRHHNDGIKRFVNRVFGPIMREHEKTKVTAASHYIISMSVVYFIFPIEVAMLSLLFIAVGDPVAGVIGASFGKIKLKDHVSLEGFMACFVICAALSALCVTHLFNTTLGPLLAIPFALLGGFIGAVAESSFKKVDDNLVIPLVSAPLLWCLMQLFNII